MERNNNMFDNIAKFFRKILKSEEQKTSSIHEINQETGAFLRKNNEDNEMAVGIICGVKTMGLLFCFYTAVQLRADCGRSWHRLRTACRCTTEVFLTHQSSENS